MLTAKQLLVTFYSFKGSNAKKKVIDTYNAYASKHGKSKSNYNSAWCSETLSAAFIKANAVNYIGGIAQDTGTHVKHFKALGIWKGGHSRTPNPGDVAIFQDKNGKPNHTEIVFSVNTSKGTFVAISGNYLGGVGLRTRKIHGSNIHGYGCPKYDNYKTVTPSIVWNVMSGKYGKGASIGTTRYNKLALEGYDPNAVQTKINWVINIAKAIKNGDAWAKEQYGNNEKRRKALGSWYNAVQKQINVLYGIDKW